MMKKDFELLNELFALIKGGINELYDEFVFEIFMFDGYSVNKLFTFLDGFKNASPKTSFNGAVISSLVEELYSNAIERNEKWCGIIMSFKKNGEVSVKYQYEYPDAYKIHNVNS